MPWHLHDAYENDDTIPAVLPADPTRPPREPRRPIIEILLDPRNIQWLLTFGGVMLVVGLVLYLYSIGVFENPVVVASLMGVGTVGLLFGGWAVLRLTPYQTAGRAMTLLACLIMPLNLWFYHANSLHPLMLHEQLWVAALACCALYAASSLILRDARFVYVLVAGICGTCLLIMADVQGEAFWQITYPAFMLVVVGLATLHVERAFPNTETGDFTRKNFGKAFFRSGHALLALGLVLILAAQLYGVLYHNDPFFQAHNFPAPAPITSELPLKLLALVLVLGGTYAYLYSELAVKHAKSHIFCAVLTLLWAEILVIELLQVAVSTELVILVLALTGAAFNLVQPWLRHTKEDTASFWARAGYPVGLILSVVPVLLGVGLHFRYLLFRPAGETYDLGWTYAGAMLITTLACALGAYVYRRSLSRVSATYLFGAAASALVGVAGALAVVGVATWTGQAPVLMLIPILYLAGAYLLRGDEWERPLVLAAHAATGLILASSLVTLIDPVMETPDLAVSAMRGFLVKRGETLNLALMLVFAEAAVFYILASFYRRRAITVYLATAAGCAALWQLLSFYQVDDTWYILTFAAAGLVLLIIHRLASLEQFKIAGLSGTGFHAANTLLAFSFVAGALVSLTRLAGAGAVVQGPILAMLGALIAIDLIVVALVPNATWRRIYVCAAVGLGALALGILAVFSDLTPPQKIEIVTVILGLALLVLGHIGWYREQQGQHDLVSFSLLLGSLMVAVALIVGVISWRTVGQFHWQDEIALLAGGALLFLSGMVLRLRATTIAGVAMLFVYVATLVIYLPWSEMNAAAIALMVGGGGIFAVGLVLSVFRDRLLALPRQIKERESVFRVLNWR